MRAILIDPFEKSVSYVEVGSTEEAIAVIGCKGDVVAHPISRSDHLVIDREALELPDMRFWTIPDKFQGPVAGRALIRGNTPDATGIAPVGIDLAQVRGAVQFLDIRFAGWTPAKPRFEPLDVTSSRGEGSPVVARSVLSDSVDR